MPTMWDRLRANNKDEGGSPMDRKKLVDWQNTRPSGFASSGGGQQQRSKGIVGGNSQYQVSISAGPMPRRPPGDYRDQDAFDSYLAPPGQAPPRGSRDYRHSNRDSAYLGRPASSVYSQPSPEAATFAAQQLKQSIYPAQDPNEISPPSSPEGFSPRNDPRRHDVRHVSPIDEIPKMSQLASGDGQRAPGNQNRQNIGMMRRERRKNSDAAATAALRESKSRDRLREPRQFKDPRWDPMTGELTTGEKGRPSQVPKPVQYAHDFTSRGSTSPENRATANSNAQGPMNFRDRLRKVSQPGAAPRDSPPPAARPEWKGGSGRTTLVAPVQDRRDVAPLNIPRRSSKRITGAAAAGCRGDGVLSPVSPSDSETPASPAQTASNTQKTATAQQKQNGARGLHDASDKSAGNYGNAQSYPSPPLSSDDNNYGPPSATLQPKAQTLLQPPANNSKTIRRKPPAGAGHHPEPSYSSSVYSHQDERSSQALLNVPDGPGNTTNGRDDWQQPPSRFSVTTYATSHAPGTPRESIDNDAPPVPTPPQHFENQFSDELLPPRPSHTLRKQGSSNSLIDRQRPIVSGYENAPKKPVAAEPIKISMASPYYTTKAVSARRPVPLSNKSTTSVNTLASADKSLPLAPPETQSLAAQDKVAQLNARLSALGNRRININHAIKQMTELMPQDNLLASDVVLRKREAEKRKVETLKLELAEVQREEYDLGLKLHRAYKRMDRDAEYEPTTLWVRRGGM